MRMLRSATLIVLMVLSLAGAASIVPSINAIRTQLGILAPGGGPESSQPDVVLLTHLLGGFRGLLVDAVWLRAGKLQQDGKFWELYQLYDWIGKLEPRIEEIWDFNGWNMSYNLVAELKDSEARWQWIDRAIAYLRDQGLKYNPRSGKIMERIAWIYFHKIGRDLDLHHHYYKHRWALIMHAVVGPRAFQDIPGMAEAPETLDELLRDPDVAKAFSDFKLDPPGPSIQALAEAEGLHHIPRRIIQALRAEKGGPARKKVRNFISARVFREKYKRTRMDVMAAMEKEYGKFDWRLPEPHALYWATVAAGTDPDPNRQIDYDRLVLYTMQESMRRGVIAYLGPNVIEPMHTDYDLTKVNPIDRLYEDLLRKHSFADEARGWQSVRDGHEQFLKQAAFQLYFSGYLDKARRLHLKRYRLYDKPHPWMEMEPYVLGQVKELVDEFGTRAQVEGYLVKPAITRACIYLCMNKPSEAGKWESLARDAWRAYRKYTIAQAQDEERYPTIQGGPHEGRLRNVGLPTFEKLEREHVRNMLRGQVGFPPELLPILRKRLGVKKGAEKEYLPPGAGLAPRVPPSSPEPE